MISDPRTIPELTMEGIIRYVKHGILPGDFLRAVISNDLKESFARADIYNREAMFQIVSYFYNATPGACWGSRDAMVYWANEGGAEGLGISWEPQ